MGDLELKGLPEPVPAAEVAWVPARDAPALPLPARMAVPHLAGFVGRATERELLDAALEAATGGERRGVLLAGEAGMGKPRLVSGLARDAHQGGTRRGRGPGSGTSGASSASTVLSWWSGLGSLPKPTRVPLSSG